ncbi:hypothetical protein AAY473_037220 [Plecturocebus cupreus]
MASSIKSSTSSGGDLETLAQQALQCNCVVAAYIGNKDLETLILQALHHDLMASSFTQRTTQSTVAQQSSQEATVLQATQAEAVLAWPTKSWACRRAARRCILILMGGPNKPSIITTGGDLETLPQQALPRHGLASSIKSSTSSDGNLETLAQEALQCNCVVAAYIGNKDLETLNLEALQHDLMASSFTRAPTGASWLKSHDRQPPFSKLGSPGCVGPAQEAGVAEGLPGDAFQY